MLQSLKIFNVFKTWNLKQIFGKTKNFFNESTSIKNATFSWKLPFQNMLTQLEREVKNGPFTKNRILQTTLFF